MSNIFSKCQEVGMDTHISNPKSCLFLSTSSTQFSYHTVIIKLRCHKNNNIIKTSSPDTDYSPWGERQVNWYQTGNKICYIPKVSKFYVEKGYLVYVRAHQITFSTVNRFCQLSKTLPQSLVLIGHNQAAWNTEQN